MLAFGPVAMDPASRRVTADGVDVLLPAAEFELLRLLLRERGRCIPRRQLAVAIRAVGAAPDTLDEHIRALRSALPAVLVVAARGTGYRLALPPPVPLLAPAPDDRSRRGSA